MLLLWNRHFNKKNWPFQKLQGGFLFKVAWFLLQELSNLFSYTIQISLLPFACFSLLLVLLLVLLLGHTLKPPILLPLPKQQQHLNLLETIKLNCVCVKTAPLLEQQQQQQQITKKTCSWNQLFPICISFIHMVRSQANQNEFYWVSKAQSLLF